MENATKPANTHGSPLISCIPKTLRQRYRALQPNPLSAPEIMPVFGIGAWQDAWYFSYYPN